MADIHDLLFVVDATMSMASFLRALSESVPDIIRLSLLTDCFARIGIVAYREYGHGPHLFSWSGWYWVHGAPETDTTDPADPPISQEALMAFAADLVMRSGIDVPEASKTGLAVAYHHMRPDAETVVLLYADAPPHTASVVDKKGPEELAALMDPANAGTYGPDAAVFTDWVQLTRLLRGGDDDKNDNKGDRRHRKRARVFSLINGELPDVYSPFLFLSARTGGSCFVFTGDDGAGTETQAITDLTLAVLLVWMGMDPAEGDETRKKQTSTSTSTSTVAAVMYRDATRLALPQSETDPAMDGFWPLHRMAGIEDPWWCTDDVLVAAREQTEANVLFEPTAPATLSRRHVTPANAEAGTGISVAFLARRYAAGGADGAAYRARVVATLRSILEANPAAMTANAVFGGLWRAVAQDRSSPDRDDLVALFGRQISSVQDPASRARLHAWLDASYDFAGEIRSVLDAVPSEARFPCVFLDPTLDFSQQGALEDDKDSEDGDEDHPSTFTRSKLLEIGRSCHPAILRRLGQALTRLTYVATEDDLPAHVVGLDAVASNAPNYVPRIPLSLAEDGNSANGFWRILLHTIVPGTRLGARSAALLAALSLRMGIAPLRDVALAKMRWYRDRWNDLAIPETWNISCLSLLLAADTAAGEDRADVLTEDDRRLFKNVVDYHMADRNRATTLTAFVGWTPDKTRAPTGPTVRCRVCGLPRSVTVMAPDAVCGLCVAAAAAAAADPDPDTPVLVYAGADTAATPHAWVECSVRACRAQYVVYDVDNLKTRPKCHACRAAQRFVDTAGDDGVDRGADAVDWVTCTRCRNRVIWPAEYRTAAAAAAYLCPPCAAGTIATVVRAEMTADALVAENGLGWLLRNDGGLLADPLSGRSVFQTVSQPGVVDGFRDGRIAVLPSLADPTSPPPALTLRGKPLHTVPGLLLQLRSWIDARSAERDTCSLCFDTFRRAPHGTGAGAGPVLRRACGRRGCLQRICPRCSADWYGLNRRGRVLNAAALCCPFCRRAPTPGTVSAAVGSGAGAGLHLLANLRDAVEAAGQTVYAWCYACGEAKPYAARVCGGAHEEDGAQVERWHCDACAAKAEAAEEAQSALPPLRIKPCPGCGAPTEKAGGCNHIACTAPGCHAHWCFQCGALVRESTIYDHMNAVHNGFYGGMGAAYEDAEDEEDDDDSADDDDVCLFGAAGLLD